MESLGEPTADRPSDFNGLFLTNWPYHWEMMRPAPPAEYLSILPGVARHPLGPDLLARIHAAVGGYGAIPPRGIRRHQETGAFPGRYATRQGVGCRYFNRPPDGLTTPQAVSLDDSNTTRTESSVAIRLDPRLRARSACRSSRIVTDTNRSSVRGGRWGRV